MFINEIFPRLGDIYFGGLLGGENFFEKPIFKKVDINLKKNDSVLLNISGLDSHFIFDESSTTIRFSNGLI